MIGNPYRDPAMRLELGHRALDALMTGEDWREIIRRYVEMELGPYIDVPATDWRETVHAAERLL